MGKRLNHKETIVDNIFVYIAILNVINDNEDHELHLLISINVNVVSQNGEMQ